MKNLLRSRTLALSAIPAILHGILIATPEQHEYSLRWQAVGSGFCERSSSLMLSRRPRVDKSSLSRVHISTSSPYFDRPNPSVDRWSLL